MKCVILAAGYATRLYPLTENFPKPLLKVGEKTILDWLIDDIDTAGKVDGYIVVTNSKFFAHFRAWAEGRVQKITVLDDGTSSNETRLGAVRDILFAIETLGLDDDLLVIAGDNVLDFSLTRFIAFALRKGTSCVMRYREDDEKKLQKSGVSEIGDNDRLLGFKEKPKNPRSHWGTPPFYFYTAADAKLIKSAVENGCPTDAPGSLVGYLCQRTPMHSMLMPGSRYDVGSLESYEHVQKVYRGVKE